jgi:hypothetical protein
MLVDGIYGEEGKMKKLNLVTIILFCLFAGCASIGLNSVVKLKQFSPGMSQEEVIKILGEPKSSQLKGNELILKYTLHENWKGYVPHYIIFNAKTKKLVSWYADENEFQKGQERLAETLKPLLSTGGGTTTAGGPDDLSMKQWIAGEYYSYVGSTERKLILCENGKFSFISESSYSGNRGSDGTTDWGAASRSGKTGTWTIQGTKQQGTITLTYTNGKSNTVKYRPTGETNVMKFDDIIFSFVKKAECP